ncbi:RCC2 protein, partial [Atractosteus spatula]|nr:RCC2 protein [Atractosteus spatula]
MSLRRGFPFLGLEIHSPAEPIDAEQNCFFLKISFARHTSVKKVWMRHVVRWEKQAEKPNKRLKQHPGSTGLGFFKNNASLKDFTVCSMSTAVLQDAAAKLKHSRLVSKPVNRAVSPHAMPRKKVTDVSGNGGVKRKRAGGRRKERDFSSDDEFDDFEQENAKKPGRPAAKSGLQPVTVAEDVKEKIKLDSPKVKGQLLIFGATNWDLIGRKEVPKQQAAYRNLGQNLWGPHRYGCLSGVQVSAVVSGPCAAHSLLITAEGKLWSWGRNEKGQLGHGDTKRVEAPKLVEALGSEVIVAAACGRNHTMALTENGSAFSFGENKLGQLGHGNQTDAVPTPAQHARQPTACQAKDRERETCRSEVLSGKRVKEHMLIQYNGQPLVKVACGAEFSMVVDCKGNLYSFGCPEYGQLGHNSDGKFIARAQRIEFDCELIPRRVAIFIEKTKDGQVLPVPNVVVRDVACGANHSLVLDSQKRVFSWGFGGYGRLGHTEQKDEMVPRLVKLFDFPGRGASQVYCGYQCSFAVSETGDFAELQCNASVLFAGGLFFWGVTNTSRESTMYPKAVQDLCGWKIRSLACGKSSIIIAADESTISWGPSPTYGELGYGDNKPKSSTTAQEVKTMDGVYSEQVAMGYSHSLVIAREETEQEKERLKKLPEYNPRML